MPKVKVTNQTRHLVESGAWNENDESGLTDCMSMHKTQVVLMNHATGNGVKLVFIIYIVLQDYCIYYFSLGIQVHKSLHCMRHVNMILQSRTMSVLN